jgi:steroid delta-isomerase-like uncharacterized protein
MGSPNAELARRWFEEVWNQRRTATIDELLTEDSVGHTESGDVPGVEAFKRLHADFLAAFPDLRLEVEAVVADGDDVVVRWRATGRHAGDGLGVKATHEPVTFRGMTWHRYEGGKLVEGWDAWNHSALVGRLRAAERKAGGGSA